MIDLVLKAAKHALLPDILVSSLGSLICVGLTALSTGNQKLNEKELKMYHDIAKSNWTRLRIRSSAKITIFSLILYLEWTNKIE